jgi:hypothetical protein
MIHKEIHVKCKLYPKFENSYFKIRIDVRSPIINESFYYTKQYIEKETFIDEEKEIKDINKEYLEDELLVIDKFYFCAFYNSVRIHSETTFTMENYTTIMNKLTKTDFIKTKITSFIKEELDKKEKDRLLKDKQKVLSKPVTIKFTVEV